VKKVKGKNKPGEDGELKEKKGSNPSLGKRNGKKKEFSWGGSQKEKLKPGTGNQTFRFRACVKRAQTYSMKT